MINKALLKIIFICSFIIGGILGLIPLIPAFIWIAFLAVMFLVAPFIIIYLKKLNLISNVETERCMFIGAISGASAFLGFATIYFPIAFILNLIFKIQSFLWIKVIFMNIGFLIPMIILIALLCGLMNTFSGFLTAYLYEYFKPRNRG
ncbi:TPA: hypothetical protein IAA87_11380 [Candidatus Avigastranaerophilus faecigallinarum]|nr:hypothetical protein [Candidatus Avigastranaerophilus faecigallinarum]